MTHYYAWRNNEKRVTMYRRPCRIVARGAMSSIMIEFEDGQREIVSRRSVRRLKLPIDKPPAEELTVAVRGLLLLSVLGYG